MAARRHRHHPLGPRIGDGVIGWCDVHDKLLHGSKKGAKRYLRARHHTGQHPNVYPCTDRPGLYHIGNLAPNIIKGRIDRSMAYYNTALTHSERNTDMTASYTTETPGFTAAASPNGNRTQADNMAANRMFDSLLADLSTYRYEVDVPVTPSLARRIIDLNADNNRNLLVKTAETYARDMRNGKWRERTGQTVKVATDGRLIDGLHRMNAVVQSGRTVMFDLAFGVSPKDIVVVDSGRTRNRDAIIKTAGGGDLQGVSACVTWVWAFRRGYYTGTAGSMVPTATEVVETYQADANMFEAAARRGADLQTRSVCPKSVGATAYFLLAEVDKREADDMFDMLVSGVYGVPDPSKMAVYHLREKLIRRRDTRLNRQEQLAMFFIAWNRRTEPVSKFQIGRGAGEGKLTNGNFPKIKQQGRKGA